VITNAYLRYISRKNKFVYPRFKKYTCMVIQKKKGGGVYIIHTCTPSTCDPNELLRNIDFYRDQKH
jgi:hypothetical protein